MSLLTQDSKIESLIFVLQLLLEGDNTDLVLRCLHLVDQHYIDNTAALKLVLDSPPLK